MGLNAGIEKRAQRRMTGAGTRHDRTKTDIEDEGVVIEDTKRKEFGILRAIRIKAAGKACLDGKK
jgi:hypothetical protein